MMHKDPTPGPDYYGHIECGSTVVHRVGGDGTVTRVLPHRCVGRSFCRAPLGWEWGRMTAKAEDLARNLLWDTLGSRPSSVMVLAFTYTVLLKLPADGWRLSQDRIMAWKEDMMKRTEP